MIPPSSQQSHIYRYLYRYASPRMGSIRGGGRVRAVSGSYRLRGRSWSLANWYIYTFIVNILNA
jgi:hypothetical protein